MSEGCGALGSSSSDRTAKVEQRVEELRRRRAELAAGERPSAESVRFARQRAEDTLHRAAEARRHRGRRGAATSVAGKGRSTLAGRARQSPAVRGRQSQGRRRRELVVGLVQAGQADVHRSALVPQRTVGP
jgi:hypothetical protein